MLELPPVSTGGGTIPRRGARTFVDDTDLCEVRSHLKRGSLPFEASPHHADRSHRMAQRIIKVPVTSLEDREERQKISDELNRRRIRVVCMTTHGNDVYMVLEGDDTETLAI